MHNNNKKQNTFQKLKEFCTKDHKLQTSLGFTLIETLVAITVLLLSITGPLEIASKSLFSAFYARDQITAHYLAQEGIEYIKNARDTTFLYDAFSGDYDNNYWLDGLNDCIEIFNNENNDFSGCYIDATITFDPSENSDDYNNDTIKSCSDTDDGICPKMSLDPTTNLWTQEPTPGPNITKFRRKIEIIPQGNGYPIGNGGTGIEEAIIKVTIEWPTVSLFGGTKTFELKGTMMNWERK